VLTDLARWDDAESYERRAAAEWVDGLLDEQFTLDRMEVFSCGGESHEVAVFSLRCWKTRMEFSLLPAATFVMGTSSRRRRHVEFVECGVEFTPDQQRHTVVLTRPFLVARTELTQYAWRGVMSTNPSLSKGADRPIEGVSWQDAVDFCERFPLSRCRLRLPTEAQWEYACRAGTTSPYSCGDESGLAGVAWYRVNSGDAAHRVGRKLPNAFGLFDMHGNVSEWCSDWFADYRGFPVDPIGPPLAPRPPTPHRRVVRGGGYRTAAGGLGSPHRAAVAPWRRAEGLGFRPVRNIDLDRAE
jgi:formylglycine-generating enzyme required for sulfatase activity